MSIGKAIAEACTDGVIFTLVTGMWNMLKSIFTEEMKAKTKEKLGQIITGKGWDDEHYFLRDLNEANLTTAERKNIRDGVKKAEDFDKLNGTKSARNFRVIVTIHDLDCPDPSSRPGKDILEKIGKSCANADEVFVAIEMTGAMHESGFSLEKFLHVAIDKFNPFLERRIENVKSAAAAVAAGVKNYADRAEKEYEDSLWFRKIPGIGGLFK